MAICCTIFLLVILVAFFWNSPHSPKQPNPHPGFPLSTTTFTTINHINQLHPLYTPLFLGMHFEWKTHHLGVILQRANRTIPHHPVSPTSLFLVPFLYTWNPYASLVPSKSPFPLLPKMLPNSTAPLPLPSSAVISRCLVSKNGHGFQGLSQRMMISKTPRCSHPHPSESPLSMLFAPRSWHP